MNRFAQVVIVVLLIASTSTASYCYGRLTGLEQELAHTQTQCNLVGTLNQSTNAMLEGLTRVSERQDRIDRDHEIVMEKNTAGWKPPAR